MTLTQGQGDQRAERIDAIGDVRISREHLGPVVDATDAPRDGIEGGAEAVRRVDEIVAVKVDWSYRRPTRRLKRPITRISPSVKSANWVVSVSNLGRVPATFRKVPGSGLNTSTMLSPSNGELLVIRKSM